MGAACGCAEDDFVDRILMLGFRGVGKSTILQQLKDDETIEVFETLDFNTETLEFDEKEICVWDLGGPEKVRPLWRHYYKGTSAIIFVIDASQEQNIKNTKKEIHNIMKNPELSTCPLLVFANKIDLNPQTSLEDLEYNLELSRVAKVYHIEQTSALNGKGLSDGMKWLLKHSNKSE